MSDDFYDDERPRKRKRTNVEREDSDAPKSSRRGGRRSFRWFALLVLLALLVIFLPTIVAKMPLRDLMIARFLPDDRVQLAIGDLSLGWFTPPVLTDVKLSDGAGQPLLLAETLRLERSTWQLATNSRDLGTIELVRPTLYITIRPDGSNWEDAVNNLLASFVSPDAGQPGGAAAPSEPVQGSVKLIEGTILAQDAVTGRQWRIEGINIEYQLPSSATDSGRLSAVGRIVSGAAGGPQSGSFAVALGPAGDGRQQMKLKLVAVPMVLADPLLRRYLTGVELGGILSGEGTATWTASELPFPNDLATFGRLQIERLDMTAPALAGDRVQLPLVEMPWQLSARPGGLAIDTLELRSDVGRAAMRGTLVPSATVPGTWFAATAGHDVEVRASLDLARLAAMLPRTLRIREGTTITSGSVDVSARCQPADGGQSIAGSLQTTALAATNAGRPFRWDAPASAKFALRRQADEVQLDSLQFDSEFLHVDTSGTSQQLAVHATFDLSQLSAQLGQFVDLSSADLAGQGELKATVRSAGDVIDVSDARLLVTKLRAVGTGWRIDEPRVEVSGNVAWDFARGQFTSDTAQAVTSTISLATKDVRFAAGEQGIAQLNGLAAFRVDLARLAAWQGPTSGPPPWEPQGMVTGNVRFDQQAGRVLCDITAQGQNLSLVEHAPAGPQTIWTEPQLSLRGRATYGSAADRLSLDAVEIESAMLQATIGGQIEHVTTTIDTNVNGTLNYDLAQLSPLLRPYVGDGIQLAGRETARFSLNGPLRTGSSSFDSRAGSSATPAIHWSRQIKARVEAPWASANVYGLPVGPGKLNAALGDGAVQVEPMSLTLAEGRLNLAPHLRLDPEPAELALPAGPVLENVRITPQVSDKMLQYVAPVLSGVTRSEGLFSMKLAGLRVPLAARLSSRQADTRHADGEGQLTVHSVQVQPGPLASQWVQLAQQIEAIAKKRDPLALAQRQPATLLSIDDQTVNFRVVNGRVYHQNMQFRVGDVVLRSQGSVGFDETLALTLTVPIQDRWVDSEKLLVGLKGQSLSIPISGTLRRPQMDQRAVADLSSKMIQSAAQQTIGTEVNKALDKLFKSR